MKRLRIGFTVQSAIRATPHPEAVRAVEHAAEIAIGVGFAAAERIHKGGGAVQMAAVDVADGGGFDVRVLQEVPDAGRAHAAAADEADADPVAGRGLRAGRSEAGCGRAEKESSGGAHGAYQDTGVMTSRRSLGSTVWPTLTWRSVTLPETGA